MDDDDSKDVIYLSEKAIVEVCLTALMRGFDLSFGCWRILL